MEGEDGLDEVCCEPRGVKGFEMVGSTPGDFDWD